MDLIAKAEASIRQTQLLLAIQPELFERFFEKFRSFRAFYAKAICNCNVRTDLALPVKIVVGLSALVDKRSVGVCRNLPDIVIFGIGTCQLSV